MSTAARLGNLLGKQQGRCKKTLHGNSKKIIIIIYLYIIIPHRIRPVCWVQFSHTFFSQRGTNCWPTPTCSPCFWLLRCLKLNQDNVGCCFRSSYPMLPLLVPKSQVAKKRQSIGPGLASQLRNPRNMQRQCSSVHSFFLIGLFVTTLLNCK